MGGGGGKQRARERSRDKEALNGKEIQPLIKIEIKKARKKKMESGRVRKGILIRRDRQRGIERLEDLKLPSHCSGAKRFSCLFLFSILQRQVKKILSRGLWERERAKQPFRAEKKKS